MMLRTTVIILNSGQRGRDCRAEWISLPVSYASNEIAAHSLSWYLRVSEAGQSNTPQAEWPSVMSSLG